MPGHIDPASGVYIYAADDIRAPMHEVLNLGQEADAVQRAADRDRIDALEAETQALLVTGTTVVYRTANGTLPSDTNATYVYHSTAWQAVDGDDELDAWASGNPTRLTAPVAGLYQVIGVLRVQQTTSDLRSLIRVNGTTDYSRSLDDAVGSGARYPVLKNEIPSIFLNAGDYVEHRAASRAASNQVIAADRSYFYLRLLRSIAS